MTRAVHAAIHALRYGYDRRILRFTLSSVFRLFSVKRASNPYGYWRFLTRTTPGHPPDLGRTWPGLLPLKAGLLSIVVVFEATDSLALAASSAPSKNSS